MSFCTTDAPRGSIFYPYMKEGPTCLLLLAFAFSFAGLIVGSMIVVVIRKAQCGWFCNVSCVFFCRHWEWPSHIGFAGWVMLGTRARIWLTMILLGYPFWAIGASHALLLLVRNLRSLPFVAVADAQRTFACGRVVGSRIFFPVAIDQMRRVFSVGFTVGVRCCVHVDSCREN